MILRGSGKQTRDVLLLHSSIFGGIIYYSLGLVCNGSGPTGSLVSCAMGPTGSLVSCVCCFCPVSSTVAAKDVALEREDVDASSVEVLLCITVQLAVQSHRHYKVLMCSALIIGSNVKCK